MKKLSICLFGCFLSLITISHADQHHNMLWQYYQYNDEMNQGRTTSTIIVGIPETDNVVVSGSCHAGLRGDFSTIMFGAPVYEMQDGEQISVEFHDDGFNRLYDGLVTGTKNEVGVAGVEFQINNDDPLWFLLQEKSYINYTVNGQTADLTLRGSGMAISRFLADCRYYANNFADYESVGSSSDLIPSNPENPSTDEQYDPRWATCDVLRNAVSQNSDMPLTITFVNKSDGHRSIMWVGFDGVPEEYAALNSGEEFTIDTFLTHPWMFTDGPGNCLEMFMPQLGVPVFHITAPNRDFGPE